MIDKIHKLNIGHSNTLTSYKNDNTKSRKIITNIIREVNLYYNKQHTIPKIYISYEIYDLMVVFNSYTSISLIDIEPNKPIGKLSGYNIYLSDLLDGYSFYLGDNINVIFRKDKIKRLLNEIRNR